MRSFFGYIRVSTARQGEGVSLSQQRDAIVRYAEKTGLSIGQWFEEKETAAKRGRPVFSEMLTLLRKNRAAGVIIHKIDRSARNLRDWADLGELIDHGIDVRFASESLDLQSRGGRLSADIQAVVAADFIRNLREETRKGLYGRLKQGILPMPAPVGYLDRGAGKPKEPDPVRAPLLRNAFELYATGRFTLKELATEMTRRGLTSRCGGTISRNGWSVILNNPFYVGLIRIRRTGQTFAGAHAPIVTTTLFRRVQEVLQGKVGKKVAMHGFLFRRLLSCQTCGYSLIGELQKGHVYYRCHTRSCPTTSIREEHIEKAIVERLRPLQFSIEEKRYLEKRLTILRQRWEADDARERESLTFRSRRIAERLGRLTDAYLDGTIDKRLFEERKTVLLMERQETESQLSGGNKKERPTVDRLALFLELAGSACLGYKAGDPDEKRELVTLLTSNRIVRGKTLEISLIPPFQMVADRYQNADGRASRTTPRTWDGLIAAVGKWLHRATEDDPIVALLDEKRNESTERRKGWKVAA